MVQVCEIYLSPVEVMLPCWKKEEGNTLSHMDWPDGISSGRETANITDICVSAEFMYGDKYGTLISAIMLAEARTQTRGISLCKGNTSILNRIGPIGLDLHNDVRINYKSTTIQLLNPFIYDIPSPILGTITTTYLLHRQSIKISQDTFLFALSWCNHVFRNASSGDKGSASSFLQDLFIYYCNQTVAAKSRW